MCITLCDLAVCVCVYLQLVNDFAVSEPAVSAKLLGMLSKQGSALSEGLKTLKEDLTFAEDLVLVRSPHFLSHFPSPLLMHSCDP